MKTFFRNWVPVIIWCLIIFYLSSRPNLEIPIKLSYIDLGGHAAFYALLALLLGRAVQLKNRSSKLKYSFAVIISATIYGAFNEVYQSYIPTRDPSLADEIANLAGACIGVLMYYAYIGWRSRLIRRRLEME